MVRRNRIHRNPGSASEALPVQRMCSSFYPYFITGYLTQGSMEEFTQTLVAGDLWDSLDTNARVSCLPGRPLYLNIRRFTPNFPLCSIQQDPQSQTMQIQDSLPVGIYGADPIKLARTFNDYLNNIARNHLVEQTEFIFQVREADRPDHSSRVLSILFMWFERWKETVS